MNEYVIVGDTERYNDCLVRLCGTSFEQATEILNRMLKHPTKEDKTLMIGHSNFRIKEVEDEDCWWHYGCD